MLVADPGMGDPVLSAERLDLGAAVGLERFAPGQAEAGAVVAHVEDAQAPEAFQQFVRQVAEHQRLAATGVAPPSSGATWQWNMMYSGQSAV